MRIGIAGVLTRVRLSSTPQIGDSAMQHKQTHSTDSHRGDSSRRSQTRRHDNPRDEHGRFSTEHDDDQTWDSDYRAWRESHAKKLDDDYRAFASDRQKKFGEEFEAWRKSRKTDDASSSDTDHASSSRRK